MDAHHPSWLVFPAPTRPERGRFLPAGANDRALVRAAAENHISWFAAKAISRGGEMRTTEGVTWTVGGGEATIPFPKGERESIGRAVDAILAECRAGDVTSASCWSLSGRGMLQVAAAVTARGFEWGWQPHWMAINLDTMSCEFKTPAGLKIEVDDDSDWIVEELPYYHRDEAATLQKLSSAEPRNSWHFCARLHGKVVGHSLLHLTRGGSGVGGIYNVGVIPQERGKGIGSAISYAACRFAGDLGAHHALLNSAADALYEELGFRSLGRGQSWWMHKHQLAAPAATVAQIAFVEALVLEDVEALERLTLPDDLDAPLPNGMSAMRLVVGARRPKSAKWLEAHGADLGLADAWELGLKARAARMLARQPELANRRSGGWQTTPLHDAIMRDDVELIQLLLSASPDLSITDGQFHGTAMGWARHMNRAAIEKLLIEAGG